MRPDAPERRKSRYALRRRLSGRRGGEEAVGLMSILVTPGSAAILA
jgi:hypothetical protein